MLRAAAQWFWVVLGGVAAKDCPNFNTGAYLSLGAELFPQKD